MQSWSVSQGVVMAAAEVALLCTWFKVSRHNRHRFITFKSVTAALLCDTNIQQLQQEWHIQFEMTKTLHSYFCEYAGRNRDRACGWCVHTVDTSATSKVGKSLVTCFISLFKHLDSWNKWVFFIIIIIIYEGSSKDQVLQKYSYKA